MTPSEQHPHTERVLVAVVDLKIKDSQWSTEHILHEMKELIQTCGGMFIEYVACPLDKPIAKYLIREGKLEELRGLCAANTIDTVIFSHDLKGGQQRNLEQVLEIKTIDRTQLILDIFAKHASSREGKMQVELAQLEYLLPRLVGHGIELSRLGGGIGTLGPGETKLEMDRRRIGQRISRLKQSLSRVAAGRDLKRKRRKDRGMPAVSLVGYTNAGKSTLLNALTHAGQITNDGLFTTLDSLSRQLILPNHQKIVLSDTVGFMHELPHRLIESFKATLEEVKQADLLLHVIDVSHPRFRLLYDSVESTLKELDALDKPTIIILNKIDLLEDQSWLKRLEKNFEHTVSLSAKENQNIDGLLAKIIKLLNVLMVEINVDVPISRMDLVSLVHEEGNVYSIKYDPDTINIRALIPARLKGKFETNPFRLNKDDYF